MEPTHNSEKKHHEDEASPIRTYSTDLAQAVRKDEMSVIKAAMQSERQRQEEEMAKSASSPKNRLYIIVGIALIAVTLLGIMAVQYYKNKMSPDIIPSQAQIPSLITAENTTSLEVGGMSQDKIVDLVRTAANNLFAPNNEIVNIYLTDASTGKKHIIETQTFLTNIKSQAPFALTETLSKNFMFGVYTKAEMHYPFLILQTTDFSNAFPAMASWERDMFSDFYLPFNLPNNEDYFTTKFTDQLVENRDTRVVKNDAGEILLLYGFADEKSLIITTSIDSYTEILHRVQSVR